MKPLFFGKTGHQLFGVFHPPVAQQGKRPPCSEAILLCYPGVQEYNGNHWAFRRIASHLSRLGCPVLRFDYFGTGDSMGQLSEAGLPVWVDDVRQAARELTDMTGNPRLSILGMRLGASLAYLACRDGLSAMNLIMWEPVISGRDYIRELQRRDRLKRLIFLHSALLRRNSIRGANELFGYKWPSDINDAIESMNLLKIPAPSVKQMSVVTSWKNRNIEDFRDVISSQNVTAAVSEVNTPDKVSLDTIAMRETNVLPNEILNTFVRILSGDKTPHGTATTA